MKKLTPTLFLVGALFCGCGPSIVIGQDFCGGECVSIFDVKASLTEDTTCSIESPSTMNSQLRQSTDVARLGSRGLTVAHLSPMLTIAADGTVSFSGWFSMLRDVWTPGQLTVARNDSSGCIHSQLTSTLVSGSFQSGHMVFVDRLDANAEPNCVPTDGPAPILAPCTIGVIREMTLREECNAPKVAKLVSRWDGGFPPSSDFASTECFLPDGGMN